MLNQKQGEQLRALFNAHKEWQRLQRCEAEIALLPLTPEPPAEWYKDAPQLERQQRDITVQQNGLSGDIAKLQEKLASYHIDDALLALADDINSVSEAYSIYRNSLNDVAAQQEYDTQTTQLQQLQQALGQRSTDVASLLIPAPQIAALSNLIEQHSDIERDYRQTGQEYQKLQASLENHQTSTATIDDDDYNQLLAQYNAWDSAVNKYQREQDILDAAQLKTRQELAEKQAQLKTLQGRTGIIDDDTTAATRKRRDALWQTHLQQLDESTAAAFKQALDDDDRLQQQRFQHINDLATFHGLQLDISKLETATTTQQQQAGTLQATKSTLCDAISVIMQQNSVAVLEGQEDSQLDMVLHQFKQFLDNTNQQKIIQKEKQEQSVKDLAMLKQRQVDFETAEQKLHGWQQQWQTQLSRCWLDNAANPTEVKDTLNILQEVKPRL